MPDFTCVDFELLSPRAQHRFSMFLLSSFLLNTSAVHMVNCQPLHLAPADRVAQKFLPSLSKNWWGEVCREQGECVLGVQGRKTERDPQCSMRKGTLGKPRHRSPRQPGCIERTGGGLDNYPSLTVQSHPSACAGTHVPIARECCHFQVCISLQPALTQPGQQQLQNLETARHEVTHRVGGGGKAVSLSLVERQDGG